MSGPIQLLAASLFGFFMISKKHNDFADVVLAAFGYAIVSICMALAVQGLIR